MPAQRVTRQVEPGRDKWGLPNQHRLLAVVGFDGSESAYRALDAATQLISGRNGSIVVVFVAHLPATAELSPEALVELLHGFDLLQEQLTEAIRNRLEDVAQHWSFQRRDGNVAHELAAAADQVRRDYDDAIVVIVVGSALHTYHHVVGSVPVALVRHPRYPIVVVP